MKLNFLYCTAVASCFFAINHMAIANTTDTQTVAIQIPEVNLLDIPETVYLNLEVDDSGFYSGRGEFTYAITTNIPSSSTKQKRIAARIQGADFGDQGRLAITMTAPSTLSAHTTFFQQGETDEKVLIDAITNVAQKDLALSIEVEKLSLDAVKAYLDPVTMSVRYPVRIDYKLSYSESG